MDTQGPGWSEGGGSDQPSLLPSGLREPHGGRRHADTAAETYSRNVLCRHLVDQHGEDGLDHRVGRPELVELHDLLHGLQLKLELG